MRTPPHRPDTPSTLLTLRNRLNHGTQAQTL